MKRLNLFLVALLVLSSSVSAGGLVTNTNGSAAWARTLSREASTDVDAVYFNPAGLAQLKNGLHLSLSNQTIFQTRQISDSYQFLSGAPESAYEAELTAPIFPSIYAAFKKEKWAVSAGFHIIGGGGSANFEKGLPSFEIPVASLVPMMQGALAPVDQAIEGLTGVNPGFANISGYDMSAAFNGSSNYFGIQAGVTYAITDMISVALGARYVMAKNSYEGSLSGVMINAPAAYGGAQTPGHYFRLISDNIEPYNPAGAATLDAYAGMMDAGTADAELNAVQTGSGITPIVGLNLNLIDKVNVGLKYEHHTKIELTNETEVDDVGLFPDGDKTRADLPGMFTLGVQVKPIEKLSASVGFNYFLDKPAFYGNMDENMEQINNETTIDQNAYTVSASLEYKILGILGVSAGFSTGNLGVNDNYQSDLDYALKSTSIGGGVFVDVGEMVTINAGFVRVMYDDYVLNQTYQISNPADPMNPTSVPYSDTFMKKTTLFAIGVDISL
jgi:long-chain fatty acid transport protein